ncbi:MAG: FeoA family protein [Bacteroidota bacterium]
MNPASAPLTCFSRGRFVRLSTLAVDDDEAARLRDLGLREGCRVCVLGNAATCIVGIGSCRLALQREVAMNLFAVEDDHADAG